MLIFLIYVYYKCINFGQVINSTESVVPFKDASALASESHHVRYLTEKWHADQAMQVTSVWDVRAKGWCDEFNEANKNGDYAKISFQLRLYSSCRKDEPIVADIQVPHFCRLDRGLYDKSQYPYFVVPDQLADEMQIMIVPGFRDGKWTAESRRALDRVWAKYGGEDAKNPSCQLQNITFTPIDHSYRLNEYCKAKNLQELAARHIVYKSHINSEYQLGWLTRNNSDLIKKYAVPALEKNDTDFCDRNQAVRSSLTRRIYFYRIIVEDPKPAFE